MTLESLAWHLAAHVEQGRKGCWRGSLCSRLRESIKASTDNYKPAQRRRWLIVLRSRRRARPRGLPTTLSSAAPLC